MSEPETRDFIMYEKQPCFTPEQVQPEVSNLHEKGVLLVAMLLGVMREYENAWCEVSISYLLTKVLFLICSNNDGEFEEFVATLNTLVAHNVLDLRIVSNGWHTNTYVRFNEGWLAWVYMQQCASPQKAA